MKRISLAAALTLFGSTLFASPVNHPVGANLTYGATTMPHVPAAYSNNPAVGATLLDDDKGGFGMGIVGIGLGLELGPIESLWNSYAGMQTKINEMQTSFDNVGGGGTIPDLTSIRDLEKDVQSFVREMGDSFTLDLSVDADVLSPLVFTHSKWGSFGLTVNALAQAKMAFIDDPIEIDVLKGDISTKSSAYLKAGAILEVSPFYSREILKNEKGNLYGGLRLNIYNVGLQKSVIPFLALQNAGDALQDKVKEMQSSSLQTGYGLDFGALWTTPNYRAGATLKNINAPSFTYSSVGKNCASTDSACWTILALSDRIDLDETFTMTPQLTVDGALHNLSKVWVLASSLDINSSPDLVGNKYQWFAISGSYTPKMWSKWFWIPGIRTGYRHNLAGTQMNHLTLGLTWLYAHLDFAYGLKPFDSSKVSDLKDMPFPIARSIYVNLGISAMF